jgi:hypothetical protein
MLVISHVAQILLLNGLPLSSFEIANLHAAHVCATLITLLRRF